MMCKRSQHVGPNNVASVCTGLKGTNKRFVSVFSLQQPSWHNCFFVELMIYIQGIHLVKDLIKDEDISMSHIIKSDDVTPSIQ